MHRQHEVFVHGPKTLIKRYFKYLNTYNEDKSINSVMLCTPTRIIKRPHHFLNETHATQKHYYEHLVNFGYLELRNKQPNNQSKHGTLFKTVDNENKIPYENKI